MKTINFRKSAGTPVLVAFAVLVATVIPAAAQTPPAADDNPPQQGSAGAAPASPEAVSPPQRAGRKAPDTKAAPVAPAPSLLEPFAWLEGCWKGAANRREFREHWLPLRGDLLIGVSHMVMQDKTLGFEYLRLESRPDGIYYVAVPSGKTETAYRLTERTVDVAEGRNDQIFTFSNPALEFPQKITYRRASGGWLYAVVEGKSGGKDREITYPMRRVDCQSGEIIAR